MIKKSVMLLLVLSMVMGLVSGCGSDEKTDSDNAETTTGADSGSDASEGNADGASDEKITIKFLTWQTNLAEGEEKVAQAYEAMHPNIDIVFEYYGDQNATEFEKKLDLMIMGGDEMDILSSSGYARMSIKAESNVYYPMDEFLAEEGIVADEAYSFAPKVNGSIYGLPGDVKSWYVMINKDMLEAAGLDVPPLDWTWDDYRDYAVALTQGEGASKVYGSYFHTWGIFSYMGLMSTHMDNSLTNEDGTFNFDLPEFLGWNEFRKNLELVDGASKPYSDAKAMSANYRTEFFNGQAAMIPTGSWMIPEVDDIDKYPHDFVTTFAPLPRWTEGGIEGMTNTDSHYYSIAATSKHPKEAYDFIRFYTTEGMIIRGGGVSAEAGVDKMEMVKRLMDIPELYDTEALSNVLNNPEWKDNITTYAPVYNTILDSMVMEEAEKFYLDVITGEELVKICNERAAQIKADNE